MLDLRLLRLSTNLWLEAYLNMKGDDRSHVVTVVTGKLAAPMRTKAAERIMQSFPNVKINVVDMNIDFLCIAPHKGLYAPMGTGILISLGEIPDTLYEGGTGSMSASYEQPPYLPERFESGTLNTPGIMGISAGIDFVNTRGISNIYNHELGIIRYIYEGLEKIPGTVLYTEKPV